MRRLVDVAVWKDFSDFRLFRYEDRFDKIRGKIEDSEFVKECAQCGSTGSILNGCCVL